MANSTYYDVKLKLGPDGRLYYVTRPGGVRSLTSKEIDPGAVQPGDPVAINAQTGTSYTFALTDAGKVVTMTNASANTMTVPTNTSVAFVIGTIIGIEQLGAGTTKITGATGVTINGVSAGSADISAQYGAVALRKDKTNTWTLIGGHGGVS